MVAVYILILCGALMGLMFLVEAGISVYKIVQKQGRIRGHVILAVIFAATSIVCTSSAFFLVAQKVINRNTDYKEVVRSIARDSGEVTTTVLEGFNEGFDGNSE